jgi:uncharacterized protein DUF4158
VGYPNEAERRRLERFPDRIAVEDLRACFALSDRDRVLIFDQRGPDNRLGLAVSLCALRFLGFVPDEIASIPEEALAFVAGQVDAAPHELLAYGTRAQTRNVVADETALARVAPVTHAHVNSLGRYDLNRQPPPVGHLRPLRHVEQDNGRGVPTPPLGVSGDKH